jgi:hypothetical protein
MNYDGENVERPSV